MDPEDLTPYLDLLVDFFAPLLRAVEDPLQAEVLLAELGYTPPSQLLAFNEFSAAAGALLGLVEAAGQAVEDGADASALLPKLLEALVEIGRLFATINTLADKIQANFAGSDFLTQTDILDAIPRRLADYLVVSYLEFHHNILHAALLVAGVIDMEDIDETPTPFHVPYRKRTVNWEKLTDFFNDPVGTLKSNFVEPDDFLYNRLVFLIDQLAVALGVYTTYALPDEEALAAFNNGADLTPLDEYEDLFILRIPLLNDLSAGLVLEIYPIVDAADGKYTGLGMGVRFGSQVDIPVSEGYRLALKLHASLNDSLGFTVDRDGNFSFINKIFTANPETLADTIQFGVRASLEPTEDRPPGALVLLGAPGGSRFEIGSASLSVGLEKLAGLRMFIESDLKDGKVLIGLGGADSFVSNLVPGGGIEAAFNLGVGIANDAGFYFKGASSLYLRLPVHLTVGPIEIQFLSLGAGFEGADFPLTVAGGFSANLGPLRAVVEDIGLRVTFQFRADRSGNLGILDAVPAFKPPNGVGLSLDAGVVKGGGYLFFDPEQGEYAGALELTVSNTLSLKAIGMITTRMPDGSTGFSLLVIITAEFFPGLQLGYGFTLIGVGGLLGLNRTMRLEPLMQGVRTGAINGIMFPQDPVANAPRILSDLRAIFPPQPGIFLIGPMAKLGWGTPTLVSLALGIIIEIPGNIAILGVLKLALPTEDAPLLVLQVNFAGAIEFDRSRLYFFAALFESRLLMTITLEGEMGVLVAWGGDGDLLLSVGGFHPRYTPPPLPIPTPRRISVSLLSTPVYRLHAEGYFAVTSNTIQFGARAELVLGFDDFRLQGHIAFDALINRSPFSFVVEISASVELKVFGAGLFSIRLRMTLEGPSPFKAKGTGSISFLFFEFSADFSLTWGIAFDTLLPLLDLLPLLKLEIEKRENWTARIPEAGSLLVTLRQVDGDAGEIVLHPLGVLRISQKLAPLDLTLDKVGAQKVNDVRKARLRPAAGLVKTGEAFEPFAMAQYQEMDDAAKLTRPAFEQGPGGVELSVGGQDLSSARMVRRAVRYELVTIDTNYKRFRKRFFEFWQGLFAHFLQGSAVTKSPLSRKEKGLYQPFDEKVRVTSDAYMVVFSDDNRPYNGSAGFGSEALAREFLNEQIAADPNLVEQLQVIPQVEVNNAP